jgi:hypothetical protein
MAKAVIEKPQNYVNSAAHSEHDIISVNNGNPEYGSIMLRSESMELRDGWIRPVARVGRVTNRVEELVKLVKQFNLKEGDDFSRKVMPVKLTIKEQTTPFYDGQEPKINPTTGEVITSGGKEVYRSTFVNPEGSDEMDTLLVSDKVNVSVSEGIKAVANTEFGS